MDDAEGFLVTAIIFVVVIFLATLAVGLIRADGEDAARQEFRECRTLLATADSATVLRTKPECQQWTLPVRSEAP